MNTQFQSQTSRRSPYLISNLVLLKNAKCFATASKITPKELRVYRKFYPGRLSSEGAT